jgi:hypothetical protein
VKGNVLLDSPGQHADALDLAVGYRG